MTPSERYRHHILWAREMAKEYRSEADNAIFPHHKDKWTLYAERMDQEAEDYERLLYGWDTFVAEREKRMQREIGENGENGENDEDYIISSRNS